MLPLMINPDPGRPMRHWGISLGIPGINSRGERKKKKRNNGWIGKGWDRNMAPGWFGREGTEDATNDVSESVSE